MSNYAPPFDVVEYCVSSMRTLSPRGKPKLVAVIEAYLDESGIDGSPYCLIAGYVGSERQWGKLSKAWGGARAEFNAPTFHGKRFFPLSAFKNGYPGWTMEKRREYAERLVKIVRSHRVHRINQGIEVAAFQGLTEDERRWVTGGTRNPKTLKWFGQGAPTKPYFACFMRCLGQAEDKTDPYLKLNVYMDRQPQYEVNAQRIFYLIKQIKACESGGTRLGSITFGSRSDFPPLQVADLLAYLWNIQAHKESDQFADEIMWQLIGKKGKGMPIFNKGHLELLTSDMPRTKREVAT